MSGAGAERGTGTILMVVALLAAAATVVCATGVHAPVLASGPAVRCLVMPHASQAAVVGVAGAPAAALVIAAGLVVVLTASSAPRPLVLARSVSPADPLHGRLTI